MFARRRIVALVAFACSLVPWGCAPTLEDATPAAPHRAGKAASGRPGMGAVLYRDGGGGVTFRVWAPNAGAVYVAGDFNGWSATESRLDSEGNGNFSADVPGATAGQRYKYVIHPRAGGGSFFRADPRARRMTSSVGDSVVVDESTYSWGDGGYGMPGFNEVVIYEMHIGSFNAGPGRVGTWQSAAARLDHLAALGVNLVELTPVFEFPTDISTGYNTAYPFAPESAYGTPDDMKAFIDQAHRRGIGVLLDVVHNHYGPNDMPMWCFDGECYGAGGIYFYTDHRLHTPWGPRPDYGRAQVRDFIRDSAAQWLREYHIDGLRFDATMVMREAGIDGWQLLQRVTHELKAAQPWKLLVAEDFRDVEAITRPTFAGGAGFDSQWDGRFFHPVASALLAQDDRDRNMHEVKDAILHIYNGQASQRVIYTESHDEVANGRQRLPEMIWPGNAASYYSKKRSTLGAALVLTSPGIPMLFQGQELLEDGWFAPDRPLDWSKATRFGGIVSLYRDLIRLRRNFYNNTRGLRGDHTNVFHVNNSDKVIAFHRYQHGGPGDDVVVVANFSGRAFAGYRIGFPRWGTWYVRCNTDWNGYAPDFSNTHSYNPVAVGGPKDGLGFSADVGIGPYSVIVLSQ